MQADSSGAFKPAKFCASPESAAMCMSAQLLNASEQLLDASEHVHKHVCYTTYHLPRDSG